jgi:hypothetical protein
MLRKKLLNKLPRVIGWSLFILWILWNIYWFSQRQLAPSVLIYYLGVPAPSTGMTRSLMALMAGDWWASLCWNAFTVPLLLVFVLSMGCLLKCLINRRMLLLPTWLGFSWLVVLVLAQISKWLLGPEWW